MKKRMSALVLAAAMAASAVTPAMAARSDKYDYIEDIDLKVNYSIEAGMTDEDWSVSVDVVGNSNIEFDEEEDVTVSYAPDEGETWKEGVKPKITVVMTVDKDYDWRFDDDLIEKDGGVTLTGDSDDDVTISKVSASSSKVTVTLTIPKLKYPENYWDDRLYIEDAEWGDDGVATWAENENAEGYEVRVYRGSKSLATGLKTADTEYDLSEYFTSKGEYTFKVRAYYDDYKGEWEESDDLDLDKEEAEEIRGSSSSSSSTSTSKPAAKPSTSTSVNLPSYVVKGNWGTKNGKWTFTDSKGVAYKEKWAAVYNPYANTAAGQQAFDWFYFDKNGEMVTGWILDGGLYYYCSPLSDGTQGRMVTGWFQIDGAWYYFNPNSDGTRGAMQVNKWIGNDYVGANGKFEKSR